MKRSYEELFHRHLENHRQMVFISGPRQVGKTTTSLIISKKSPIYYYFNWDNEDHQALIIEGPNAVAKEAKLNRKAYFDF